MEPIALDEYLLVAEAVTGLNAHALANTPQIVALAESALAAPFATFDGVEFYVGLSLKAAVLCSRLNRNHPLPDGNKRASYLCLIEFVTRNGADWAPVAGVAERVRVIEQVASGDLPESKFASWVERQLA